MGTVSAATNLKTGVTSRQSFSPFGTLLAPEVVGQQSDIADVNIGFTEQETDGRASLINMRGRVFDPTAGAFLSPDPIVGSPTIAVGWNKYAYALNNPVRYTDPSGFDPVIFGPAGYGVSSDGSTVTFLDMQDIQTAQIGTGNGPSAGPSSSGAAESGSPGSASPGSPNTYGGDYVPGSSETSPGASIAPPSSTPPLGSSSNPYGSGASYGTSSPGISQGVGIVGGLVAVAGAGAFLAFGGLEVIGAVGLYEAGSALLGLGGVAAGNPDALVAGINELGSGLGDALDSLGDAVETATNSTADIPQRSSGRRVGRQYRYLRALQDRPPPKVQGCSTMVGTGATAWRKT